MNLQLKKLGKLSGKKATMYSVVIEDGTDLFESFLKENKEGYKEDIHDILKRLSSISNITGAQEHFFKQYEGKPGDGVCALYDTPKRNLRLYCVRMGKSVVILGGGGPKSTRTLEEDPKLKKENFLIREVSDRITEKMRSGEIEFSEDEMEIIGDLEFYE